MSRPFAFIRAREGLVCASFVAATFVSASFVSVGFVAAGFGFAGFGPAGFVQLTRQRIGFASASIKSPATQYAA